MTDAADKLKAAADAVTASTEESAQVIRKAAGDREADRAEALRRMETAPQRRTS